jgi:hypothetical protein
VTSPSEPVNAERLLPRGGKSMYPFAPRPNQLGRMIHSFGLPVNAGHPAWARRPCSGYRSSNGVRGGDCRKDGFIPLKNNTAMLNRETHQPLVAVWPRGGVALNAGLLVVEAEHVLIAEFAAGELFDVTRGSGRHPGGRRPRDRFSCDRSGQARLSCSTSPRRSAVRLLPTVDCRRLAWRRPREARGHMAMHRSTAPGVCRRRTASPVKRQWRCRGRPRGRTQVLPAAKEGDCAADAC